MCGHSDLEVPYLAIGTGGGSRPTFVDFTLRQIDVGILIRPISAGYMHRKEIETYEKAIARPDH